MRIIVLAVAGLACGDNNDGSQPPPAEVSSGPVSIDLATMTLSVGSLSIEGFLSIGVTDDIDVQHYYDPRGGDPDVAITKATAADGDSIILAPPGPTRSRRCGSWEARVKVGKKIEDTMIGAIRLTRV